VNFRKGVTNLPTHKVRVFNLPCGLLVRQRIGYHSVPSQADGPLLGNKKSGGKMDVQALIIWLIVGAIAGWLAGMVVKGSGYGLIGDIIVGIIGGLIAGWLLPQIGILIGGGIIAAIINAFIGAVILLIILRLVRRVA
jgi:uncharacterized membrane protein YeaQ/YmgE (transglycosylase-associated protein family)